MTLLSVLSAKGAPGATTTAMLVANLWPGPSVLVDADPAGGDVAMRLLSESGRRLDPDRGLMSLLPAASRGMPAQALLGHAQQAAGGQAVVCGLAGPEQALAVTGLWPSLAGCFAGAGDVDVIADLGQTHSRSPHLPVLEMSTGALIVYRPTAWSVLHTRRRLEALAEVLVARRVVTGIVCVAGSREGSDAAAAGDRIRRDLSWVRDWGTVVRDDKAVKMFEGGAVIRPERTLLARSGKALVSLVFNQLSSDAGSS